MSDLIESLKKSSALHLFEFNKMMSLEILIMIVCHTYIYLDLPCNWAPKSSKILDYHLLNMDSRKKKNIKHAYTSRVVKVFYSRNLS